MSETVSPSAPVFLGRFWRQGMGLLAALALGWALWQGRDWWPQSLLPALHSVDARWLVAAFALNLAYRLINCAGWGWTLRALRLPVDLLESCRLWLACESLRWLPGSLWSYGSRTVLAARLGLSAPQAALSISLELMLTVLAWALTALAGWLLSPALGALIPLLPWGRLAWLAAATLATLLALGLALWQTPVVSWCDRHVSRFFDWRQLAQRQPDPRALLGIVAFYFGLSLLNGLGLWVVLAALPHTQVSLPLVIAANAIGWIAGFFAIIAPGGLGVREAGIAAVLATVVPLEQALVASALWRLVQVAAELTGLGFAALWPSRRTATP